MYLIRMLSPVFNSFQCLFFALLLRFPQFSEKCAQQIRTNIIVQRGGESRV